MMQVLPRCASKMKLELHTSSANLKCTSHAIMCCYADGCNDRQPCVKQGNISHFKATPVGVMKRCSLSRASSTVWLPSGTVNRSVHCTPKNQFKLHNIHPDRGFWTPMRAVIDN